MGRKVVPGIWAALPPVTTLLVTTLLATTPVAAQQLPDDQSLVTFNRYVSVSQRQLTGFATPGIPLGTFTLQPSVDATATYNDNVFAQESARRSDLLLEVVPALSLGSNWSDSLLSVNAGAAIDRYATLTTENTVNTNVSAYGWHDLSRGTRFRTLLRFQSQRESRESEDVFTFTRRPVRFRTLEADIGARQRFANTQLQAEASVVKSDYDDATLRDTGAVIDQDFRDSVLVQGRLRAEFGQSPAFAWFAQSTYSNRQYRLREQDPLASARESEIVELLGGARFELPILARGEIGLGYTRGSYRSVLLNPVSGLAARAQVTFFPTQLTNVIVSAERRINDTGLPASGGYASAVGSVRVDHELLRQLLLSASARYQRDTFNGVDRVDRRVELGTSASYRLNPRLSARVNVSRIDLSSQGTDAYRSFVANRFLLGVGVRQ